MGDFTWAEYLLPVSHIIIHPYPPPPNIEGMREWRWVTVQGWCTADASIKLLLFVTKAEGIIWGFDIAPGKPIQIN